MRTRSRYRRSGMRRCALGAGDGGSLLDLPGVARFSHNLFEVREVLIHHGLGVGYEPGAHFAELAAGGSE